MEKLNRGKVLYLRKKAKFQESVKTGRKFKEGSCRTGSVKVSGRGKTDSAIDSKEKENSPAVCIFISKVVEFYQPEAFEEST